MEVAEFCVMPEAVSARAYRDCVTAGKCDAPVRGCIANPAGPLPMNCVDHAQADAYCRGIGGSLPRLAEVEQAFRVASGRLVLATDTSEWVEDAFPSPTLERGAAVPCDEAGCWHMWFKAQGDPSLPNPRMPVEPGHEGVLHPLVPLRRTGRGGLTPLRRRPMRAELRRPADEHLAVSPVLERRVLGDVEHFQDGPLDDEPEAVADGGKLLGSWAPRHTFAPTKA